MATCKDCLHLAMCYLIECYGEDSDVEVYCSGFADRSKYVVREKGEWISLTACANAGVYCPICNKKVWKEDYARCNRKNKLRSNFCPNCGADMRIEEQNRARER